jgi:hypothetical protein
MDKQRTRTLPSRYRKAIYPSADENDPENIQEGSTPSLWSGSTTVRTNTVAISMKTNTSSVEEQESLDGISEYDKHWDKVVDLNEETNEVVRRRTVFLEWM